MSTTTHFRLQTWNLWWGGTKVNNGEQKMADIMSKVGGDILCTQECNDTHARSLSAQLHWHHAQQGPDCAISSSYPVEQIETDTSPFATAAWCHVDGTRVLVWSVHLAPWDYGPYAALQGESAEKINNAPEELQRQEQIAHVLKLTSQLTEESTPVIIAGDFNSPATVDWVGRNDRPDYHWLPTDAVVNAGYTDAFREIHRDPNAVWGDTWSTIEPLDKEPRDRIDFVFVKNLQVGDAVVRGVRVTETEDYPVPEWQPESPQKQAFVALDEEAHLIPDHTGNTYPSDHQMVEVSLRF
ncbi:endonuclease/exonuclease/phosphatase family protein [Corynebacterium confusum]|uniref:endonuclease/exonuclease/phosphatase family protein n=1 Tax=uncultured Corynebacterium sp. TaxID=159447 RepID=UPI0025DFE691|nr:endonuclease/exonuclease/phosphatase family protein [uncultured Corynebacterium sp.]